MLSLFLPFQKKKERENGERENGERDSSIEMKRKSKRKKSEKESGFIKYVSLIDHVEIFFPSFLGLLMAIGLELWLWFQS